MYLIIEEELKFATEKKQKKKKTTSRLGIESRYSVLPGHLSRDNLLIK